METLALQHRYAVMQRIDNINKRVGTVMANNITHANSKAVRMFNNRVWVERLN